VAHGGVNFNFILNFNSPITRWQGAQGAMRQMQEPALFDHSS
jgi:hypothetical protein